MIRFLLSASLGLAFLFLIGCGGSTAPPPPAPAGRVRRAQRTARPRLVEQYWDDYQLLNPLKLPARRGHALRSWLRIRHFRAISRGFAGARAPLSRGRARRSRARASTRNRRLTYDIFRRERELAVESFTYPSELLPVNPFRSMPLAVRANRRRGGQFAILSAKDLERWQDRAAAFSRWTQQAIANMRDGMRRGYTLPRVLVEEMLPLLAALGADTPANVFYQPLKSIPVTVSDSERRASPTRSPPGSGTKYCRLTARFTISCAMSTCRGRGPTSVFRRCRSAMPGMRS